MKKGVITLFLFFTLTSGYSTHNIAGGIYTSYLGGNQYEITILNHIRLLPPIGIFVPTTATNLVIYARGNVGSPVLSTNIPFLKYDTINSDCIDPSIIEVIVTYRDTLTLSASTYNNPSGYLLVSGIGTPNFNNLSSPIMNIYTLIPPVTISAISFINSSPIPIKAKNNSVICENEPYTFDLSAIDPDGDSLAYKFYTPSAGGQLTSGLANVYSAPYSYPATQFNAIQWANGFSETNQINGAAPNPISNRLKLDSVNGELSITAANQLGFYSVGVVIEEFRDINNDGFKELIGGVFRVMLFEVQDCDRSYNYPPNLSLGPNTSGNLNCNIQNSGSPNLFNVCTNIVNEFDLLLGDSSKTGYYQFAIEGLGATLQHTSLTLPQGALSIWNKVFIELDDSVAGQLLQYTLITIDSSDCGSTNIDSLVFWVNPQIIQGIQFEQEEEFTIYPNPAGEVLHISGLMKEENLIRIYNIHGRLVKEILTPHSELNISTKDLEPGIYLISTDRRSSKFLVNR